MCVTFGTPHEGAPFAERENSLVGLAAMMVLTGATRDGASLMQLLAYLRQERRIAGVEDLARSDVSRGRFLEALRDEERHATGDAPHERELPVLTVGGRCNPAGLSWTKRALARMAASQLDGEHDLVVELRSSRPAIGFNDVIKGGLTADCDHTSYFENDQLTADHFRRVVDILRDRVQLNAAVCARVIAAQPARDERYRRWWAAANAMQGKFTPRKPGGETR